MLSILPFTKDQKSIWRELWIAYNFDDPPLNSEKKIDILWNRIHSPDSKISALSLKTAEGKVAGFIHFIAHEYTHYTNEVWYINDLYVAEAYRRRGYARAMMEYVLERAQNERVGKVYWFTRRKNDGAQKLYDGLAGKTDWLVYESHEESA